MPWQVSLASSNNISITKLSSQLKTFKPKFYLYIFISVLYLIYDEIRAIIMIKNQKWYQII